MLYDLRPEHFHTLRHERACVVLQPGFIMEQNVKLGYSHSMEARWLDQRQIIQLATIDNPGRLKVGCGYGSVVAELCCV